MKKAIWTASFVAIVIFSAPVFAVFDDPGATQNLGYSDILPEDSVLVISFPNIDELEALFNDPSVKRLAEFAKFDHKFEEFKDQINQHLLSEIGISLENLCKSIEGDLTFALMNFSTDENALEFALMAGIKGGDDEAYSLIRAFAAAAEEHETAVQTQEIAGRNVISIGGRVYFVAGHGHLIMSNKAESISKLLADKKTLSDNPVFRQHRNLTGLSKGFSFFANLRPIIDSIKTAAASTAPAFGDDKTTWIDTIFNIFGLDYLDSVSFYLPLGENDQFKFYIHAPDYSGIITEIFSGVPVGFEPAAGVPDYFDGFFALSIREPLEIMNSIVKTLSSFSSAFSEEQVNTHFAEAKEATGIDVKEDLIAPFGSYIAGGIKFRPDFEGNISKNPFAALMMFDFEIVFSLKDPAKLLSTLTTFTEKEMDISMESENYNGATLFNFPFLGATQTLSMAIVDDKLILKLGDSTQMKLIIDAIRAGKTIATNVEFRANKGRISPKSFMFGYYSKSYFTNLVNVLSDRINTGGMTEERVKLVTEIKDDAARYFATKPSVISYAEVLDDGLYSQSDFSLKSFFHMFSLQLVSGQFGQFMNFSEDQMNTK